MIAKLIRWPGFLLFYFKEVVLSNLRVAKDVLSPTPDLKPAVIILELDAPLNDLQLSLLANLVTMTPGTLSMDASDDCRRLYIHTMYADPPDAVKQSLKENFERRIRRIA